MAKKFNLKKLFMLLLFVAIIAVILYWGVPFVASLVRTKSVSIAISSLKTPSVFWKTLF